MSFPSSFLGMATNKTACSLETGQGTSCWHFHFLGCKLGSGTMHCCRDNSREHNASGIIADEHSIMGGGGELAHSLQWVSEFTGLDGRVDWNSGMEE